MNRDDYIFYPYAARDRAIADRAKLLRQMDPTLTTDNAYAQAAAEIAAQHPGLAREEKAKREQRAFEDQLAKSMERVGSK